MPATYPRRGEVWWVELDNSRLSKKLAELDPAQALERLQQMFAP